MAESIVNYMRLLENQISVIKMWYYHKNFDRSSLVQTEIPGGFAELLQSILRTNDSFSSLIGSCLEHYWTPRNIFVKLPNIIYFV